MAHLAQQAGVPDGVLNVVTGDREQVTVVVVVMVMVVVIVVVVVVVIVRRVPFVFRDAKAQVAACTGSS